MTLGFPCHIIFVYECVKLRLMKRQQDKSTKTFGGLEEI